MRKAIVQPARHAVPKSLQVLGIATTKILRYANVLGWSKTSEEVVVGRPEERTLLWVASFKFQRHPGISKNTIATIKKSCNLCLISSPISGNLRF